MPTAAATANDQLPSLCLSIDLITVSSPEVPTGVRMAIIRRRTCCADEYGRARGLGVQTSSEVTDRAATTPAFEAAGSGCGRVSVHPQGSVSDWLEVACIS